ncbi:response regulator [Psychrobacter aestuarii]|uniref:histidine kinase n=1 Tax=Psychrobacter aestuarii TaxID=556327 RepID=A0ABN0W3S7_9GAMM|nr:response regulator [Psychrobacter aestuarii]
MRQYQSLKRLLLFYTVTLLIMLVLYYAMMLLTMQNASKKHSEVIFSTLVHELSILGVPNDQSIKSILTRPIFKDISYQLIFMQPSGQTSVYRHINPDEKDVSTISFPTVGNQATANTSAFRVNHHYLTGHLNLQDGQQLYAVIYNEHPTIPWLSYQTWLPLITALILFLMTLLYLLHRRDSWGRLLTYAESITTNTKNSYTPSPLDDAESTSEFLRLGYTLSRISYQLNSKHRRIQNLNHRLERLVERAPLPMLMVSRHGQVSFFNQRFEQVFTTSFGRDAKYVLTDFVIGSDKATQQYLARPESLRVSRTLLVYGALDKQAYQLHITPAFTEHGQINGFTVVLDNVQHFLNEKKQLQQQNKQLLEQLSDMSRLKSVLGHELRTPLNAIISTLQTVNISRLSDHEQEMFNTLSDSSQFMLTMLNDMLDMAKLEAGKLDTSYDNVDLLMLSQQLCDLMAANARRHNIELLHFFMPDAPRQLYTDGSRLRQIMLNLLDNAIKFTSTGYVALIVERVSTEHVKHLVTHTVQDKDSDAKDTDSASEHTLALQAARVWQKHHSHAPNHWLHIRVEDTGIGIRSDEKARLFSYFSQANIHIGQQFGGSGLGLAISSNFAQLLGGFIRMESKTGVGSTFHLYLPYYEEQAQLVYPTSSAMQSIHLVAIVNQAVNSAHLTRLCQQLSVSAQIFEGFDEAANAYIEHLLAAPSETHAPVLLLDYEYYMRYQDRIEDTEDTDTLTPLCQNKALPTLLLSMKPERGIPSTLLERFDGFLNKPLDVTLLLSELTRVTKDKRKTLTPPPEAPVTTAPAAIEAATESPKKQRPDTVPLILVVEDNLTNQKITVKMLEKLGYRSVVAADGQQALTTLAEQRDEIDLILMDCRMPVMDGLEATQAIRAQGDTIAIIALTANSSDEDSKACFAAGMDGFLTKPVNKNKLQETLQQFLAIKGA